VCGVGVIVNATVEHGGSILAEARLDERFATGVLADEVRDVMNDTRNGDEATAVSNLVNVVVPFDNRKLW